MSRPRPRRCARTIGGILLLVCGAAGCGPSQAPPGAPTDPPPSASAQAPSASSAPAPLGRSLQEFEPLFRSDPRWLGADAALTIPVAPDRILWLFGDTFVATSPAHRRTESCMPRNTVAIQEGRDLRAARLSFHWGRHPDGRPASFFPDAGDRFFWPGHGVRLPNGPLVVFLFGIVSTPGVGLGFDAAGRALAVIDHPDDPVERWTIRVVEGPALPFDAVPATAVLLDGDFVIGLAAQQRGTHAGALVRYPAASLARGSFEGESWWTGAERGWVPTAEVGPGGPAFVIDDAGSECSLHWEPRLGAFVHVATYGFGATTIGLRTAPRLTGPWSAPRTVYRPPESDGPRPFVYAAKAHPELLGARPDEVVITYAVNSPDFADLLSEVGRETRYWPRVVAVPLAPAP